MVTYWKQFIDFNKNNAEMLGWVKIPLPKKINKLKKEKLNYKYVCENSKAIEDNILRSNLQLFYPFCEELRHARVQKDIGLIYDPWKLFSQVLETIVIFVQISDVLFSVFRNLLKVWRVNGPNKLQI